jgi:hypothetical protein
LLLQLTTLVFFRNKLKGTPVAKASQLTSNKNHPHGHQVVPQSASKQSANNTVDLLTPPALLPAPIIDMLDDDDASIALMKSLTLEEKVETTVGRLE